MTVLATRDDVEKALGRSLTAPEQASVQGQLEEASDLVAGYLHPCPVPTPTPGPVVRVTAAAVAALIQRTEQGATTDVQSYTAGPFGVQYQAGATSSGPWLTAALRDRLRPYRCGNGMQSVALGSERT